MRKIACLNVVGLTRDLLRSMPRISERFTGNIRSLRPVLPAVTCSVQASMLTGLSVGRNRKDGSSGHGIVANGWYDRDLKEVRFWQRPDSLVHGEKVWQAAARRDQSDGFTCANLFWWHNAYSDCEINLQVRPIYKADGRKLPDCHSKPAGLRERLQSKLGPFPLFRYWGPMADISSTKWIADATAEIAQSEKPTLLLNYLPYMDYPLQQFGPGDTRTYAAADQLDDLLEELLQKLETAGYRPVLVSEYGVESTQTINAAIPINRILREHNLLSIRIEDGLDTLDPGACRAFAVVDHQIAHVYHDAQIELPEIPYCRPAVIDHPRAGETVLLADHGYWFTYDFWLDDDKAPDYARTVDIHRKPGYDPRELFLTAGRRELAYKFMKKNLGFRQYLDVIPLDTSLVRGTHGRVDLSSDSGPVIAGGGDWIEHNEDSAVPCETVKQILLRALQLD
jgi:hypothetical protein